MSPVYINGVDQVVAHAARHQDAGADEVSVASLSGELADRQKSKAGTSVLGWTANKLLKGAGAGVDPTEIDVPGGADFPKKLKPGIGEIHWECPGWYAAESDFQLFVAERIYYIPIFVSEAHTYIRIGVEVSTGAVGTADLRIFAWNNGVPGALILSAGTVDTTIIGIKEIVINQLLTRGYYFLAIRCTAAPILMGLYTATAISTPVPGYYAGVGMPRLVILYLSAAYTDPAITPIEGTIASFNVLRLREI